MQFWISPINIIVTTNRNEIFIECQGQPDSTSKIAVILYIVMKITRAISLLLIPTPLLHVI